MARKGGPLFLAGIGLMSIGAVLGMGSMFNPASAADVGLLLMFILLLAGLILSVAGLRRRIS